MEAIFYLTPQDDKTREKLSQALHGHRTYGFDPTTRRSVKFVSENVNTGGKIAEIYRFPVHTP